MRNPRVAAGQVMHRHATIGMFITAVRADNALVLIASAIAADIEHMAVLALGDMVDAAAGRGKLRIGRRPALLTVSTQHEFRERPLHVEIPKRRILFGHQVRPGGLIGQPRQPQVRQHRVGHIVTGPAHVFGFVIPAIKHLVRRFGILEAGTLGAVDRNKELPAAVFGIGSILRQRKLIIKITAVKHLDPDRFAAVSGQCCRRIGLRRIRCLIPVAGPVITFTRSVISGFKERVHHPVTKVASDRIVVITDHRRNVWRVRPAAQPTAGKVTPFAQINRVGIAHCPHAVLAGHRQTRPEDRVTRRLRHHRPLPAVTRFDLDTVFVIGMTVETAIRPFQRNALCRLRAGHAYQRIIFDDQGNPGKNSESKTGRDEAGTHEPGRTFSSHMKSLSTLIGI